MTDPRKPVYRFGEDEADRVRQIAHAHLIECTQYGAQAIGCTGASFVILGLGIWCAELAELDARAARQMLESLAVIFDPTASDTKKAHAERRRSAAVDRLLAAVDLDMTQARGRA